MVCTSCGRATKAGARFCGGCGASLASRCPACGAEADPDTRFCEACGASLVPPEAEHAVARKVVTVVFADLIGSTALHERLDPESVSRIMEGYHRSVRTPIEAHGGTVVQLLGDGVLCAFGVPRVAEDDALRAVRAAVAVQRSFRAFLAEHGELAGRVGLRVAVNTGEVVVSDDYAAGIGDPLNVAARLQQEAKDGDVLLGEATQRLVAARVTLARVGSFALKGRAEPVTAYRVVSLERPAGAAATRFVGRDDELRRLTAVYDEAISAPAARLAVLLGSPGLGKSRLLDELARQLEGRASVIRAHCDAAGGATFAPLAEALRAHLELEAGLGGEALRAAIGARVPGDEAERARIARGIAALLAGMPESPEETFFVLRRLLAAFAAEQPVVLVIDDLHWAEPLLLDFTEHLVQWGAGVPLLVLVAARPELRDARSAFTTSGGLVSEVVTLGGLDAAAATRLAASVIGADALPAAVAGRVLTTSEGNPLFLGELVRMLVNDGALRQEGDRWILAVDLAKLEMPPTIQALLAARIERLRPEERLVLERAAVVGRQFSRAAVTHLLPREAHTDLDGRLEALRRSELIEPDAGWLLGEPALRFHHVLIRDAAYRRLLRNTRAELHERFADWLVAQVSEAVEHDETIGWHLEQAHQHLRQLGPLDERGQALGERASRRLAAAGRRALARDDVPLAASLLGRALDLLDAGDPARADLALDWCEALLAAGEVGAAAGAIAELGRLIGDSDRLRAWHTCFAGELSALTDPQALRTTADAVVAAAGVLAAAGDAAGEAKAHSVHALALSRVGQVGAAEAALDKALAAARRAGDRRRANAVLAGAPQAALWGPSPVTRASGRCLDVVRVLRITQSAPAVEAVALRCQGVLEALRGRTDAAQRMIASSRSMVEELGLTQGLLETEVSAGLVELVEGNDAAAERSLRTAYEGFRERGLAIDAARAAGLLGRALLPQGRASEAEALSHESEALAGDDLQAAITWRRVRAEALALRGDHASAIEFASKAVEIAAATDALLHHADARLALAAALRAAGRSGEADAEERRAIELWEAKGATLPAERARSEAGRVEPAAPAPAASIEVARVTSRRVRANAATANVARLNAAGAARDLDAIASLLSLGLQILSHTSGVELDRPALLDWWHLFFTDQDPTFRLEPLATLGESLALCRQCWSGSAGGVASFDVGAFDMEMLLVYEVDAEDRATWAEAFAADHLGDAVARLYERYAELLPEGPERTRAAATARSVAALLGSPSRWPFAPGVEAIDHRTVGWGSVHGADAAVRVIRTLPQLADDLANHIDDVLGLRSHALLVRWTNSGTDRSSGGAFERRLCVLWIFGADGLVVRWEQFDADRVAEALARFDELTAAPPAVRRRVRANAATANAAQLETAIAARDADALALLHAHGMQAVDHPLGAVMDRQETLAWWRLFFGDRDAAFRLEPVASLGPSLALFRRRWSGSASGDAVFEAGAFEQHSFDLIEADAETRAERVETFGPDHLADAIARLYERYAEIFPGGPERTRAAATARSVAALPGPPERWPLAPDAEAVDHRLVGFGALRGAEPVLRAIRTLIELSDRFDTHIDDVLELRSDALCVRWTSSGTIRASGGPFERLGCMIWVFGADGRVVRWEQFDAEQDVEALARFDALALEPPRPVRRRVRPNAASANAARVEAAIAARDIDAFATHFADDVESVNHPTGTEYGREGVLRTWRSFLRTESASYRLEVLGTLGDSLALCHQRTLASGVVHGSYDVGPYERDEIVVIEVDSLGRRSRSEWFAADCMGDAIARLYERHAELLPEGPERTRGAATARSIAAIMRETPDRWPFAPDVLATDHRTVGFGSLRGAEAVVRSIRALHELTETWSARADEILDLRSDALFLRWTTSGTVRASGGAFERLFRMIWVFGADGRVARWEPFDVEQEAEAAARFEVLTAEPPRPIRRVHPNAATANAARLEAAVAARDADAFPPWVADDLESVHHATGATYDREQELADWRAALRARDLRLASEPLASLGESLALCRISVSASGVVGRSLDIGAYEYETIVLIEADAQERRRRAEIFADDHLGDAVVRLYERYAELLPEGPARTRAAAIARSVAALGGSLDLDRFTSAFAPDVESVDHRILGSWSARGTEALREHFRSVLDLADDVALRDDEIFGLQPDALLVRRTHCGAVRASGGSYERQYIVLMAFGSDGLLTRMEHFDTDRDAEALARFDELTTAPPEPRLANAVSRNFERFERCWRERDWNGVVATYVPTLRVQDRRAIVGMEFSSEDFFASLRWIFDLGPSQWQRELLATRGERLALFRVWIAGEGSDFGLVEVEYFWLGEVDTDGRIVAAVSFDLDALDAAYAELDARFAAGEGAPHAELLANLRAFVQAVATRDDDAIRRLLPDDLTFTSHQRLVGTEGPVGRDEWLASFDRLGGFGELLNRVRIDHVPRLSATAGVVVATSHGTFGGGAFERPAIIVFAHDGSRPRSVELFDLEQLDVAFARYEELTAAPPWTHFANAAWRAQEESDHAMERRDWDALVAGFTPHHVLDDRRSLVRTRVEGEAYLAHLKILFDARRESSRQLLATRGERLALVRHVLMSAARHGGLAEFEYLNMVEVDATGRQVATVVFDPDDLDAAYAELDARYAAGEAAPYPAALEFGERMRRGGAPDQETAAALFAPDLAVEDHSPLGWGTLDRAAYLESVKALAALAPDYRVRTDHLRLCDRGALGVHVVIGTHEGGAFEQPRVAVSEFDAQGRERRRDIYTLDQLEEARARFAALSARSKAVPRDPLAALAKPNAASAAMDALFDALAEADGWEAVRARCAADFRWEDRRRFFLLSGGVELMIASLRERAATGARPERLDLVGTAGDRVAISRVMWAGGPREGRFEMEFLVLLEANETGQISAWLLFDPDDWRAADREAWGRWLARDAAAAAVMGPILELTEAWNDRDRTRMRAVIADDVVWDDRRLVGPGRVDGAIASMDAFAVAWDLAPDIQIEPRFVLTLERHGVVAVARYSGTLSEGGAFEIYNVHVCTVERGRITRIETYEPEAADAALARLAELRPDPQGARLESRAPRSEPKASEVHALATPPNAATRAADRWDEAVAAGDWEALEAFFAPALVFEDRRRGFLTSGDRAMLLANDRLIHSWTPRISRTVLATAGDRLVLHHLLLAGTHEGGAVEGEFLRIAEIDGDGRLVAAIAFDPEDRRGASAELFERFARSDVTPWREQRLEVGRALLARDLDRLRAALPKDWVYHDHRRVGAGRLEGADAYVTWMTALFENSPDALIEPLYYLAVEPHGSLAVAHNFGTLAEGGAFETVFVLLLEPLGAEVFELDDLDLARARFEELRPDPLRIPANAASRACDRRHEAWQARDWDALRALASPDFVFEDRSKRALVSGDVEMWIENNRFVQPASGERELIGTAGDRVALERVLWRGEADGGGPVEREHLRLTEVDAEGRIRASIRFDPDDRAAAFMEAQVRFAAGEAAAVGGQDPIVARHLALVRHDWEALRRCLGPEHAFHDRRVLGFGELGCDARVESLRIQIELAPDVQAEVLHILAWNRHGRVQVCRRFGTLRDGGPFENYFLSLELTEGDRAPHQEIFEVADAERALARFDELCAGRV